MSALTLLIFLAAAVWLWQDNGAARDLARQICHQQCQRARVQLLDQTVALRRIRVHRNGVGRLALRRKFCFEFSSDGEGRRNGYLWLSGRTLEWFSMETDDGEDILSP